MSVSSIKKTVGKSTDLRLALDIGTNSIGWALYNLDKNKKPSSILRSGVRIFSNGRLENYTTLNAERRGSRLRRRQRDRYLQRRKYLLHLLVKYGLFPEDEISAKKLEQLNPYELRAKGLDEKIDIYHFGRALFHINQKRGFKSNRKSQDHIKDGLVAGSIAESQKAMEQSQSRTYGEFLWKRFQKMEETRSKPGSQQDNWVLARQPISGGAKKDNYVVYAQRSMIKDEFNKLWDFQSRFHEKLQDKNVKEIFCKAIFFQRNLKKPIVGTCEFTEMPRISKSSPYFQKFRIVKELNNLAYLGAYRSCPIIKMNKGLEFRDHIIKKLFSNKDKVSFKSIEKEFKNFFPNHADNFQSFNLEVDRKYLDGNKTNVILSKVISAWKNWEIGIQDHFIKILEGEGDEKKDMFMKDDKEVLEELKKFNKDKNLKLSKEQLEQCLNTVNKLPQGHGMYSKTAIQTMIPFLEKGMLESEAVPEAGYGHHSDKAYKGELQSKLPRYQDVLKDHCVEMNSKLNLTNQNQEGSSTFRIPNPTVHIAFNQIKLVVNDLIRVHGRPSQVVVETARDLPLGQKSKSKLNKKDKENKGYNDKARKRIEEFNQTDNSFNRLKYKLWEDQKEICIYSGKKIKKADVLTARLEVDHILPWSKTLDDSFMNKVLVYKDFNQKKGNKTPFECFSSNEEEWNNILSNVPNLKKWRFYKNALDKFNEQGDFLARQLNDTRYISRYATQYLKRICSDVWTVRGQTTFILRQLLDYEAKDRNDHKAHAKDALIIGLIDRSFVKHISSIAKAIESENKSRLENIGKAIKKKALPWPTFKEDAKKSIDQIIVSHKRKTKKEGQLHNETAYGLSKDIKNRIKGLENKKTTKVTEIFKKPIDVFHYVPLDTITKNQVKKIVSPKINEDFSQELAKSGEISKEFLIKYHQKTGIRRCRLREKKTVIPIKNKIGTVYKSVSGDSNYAMYLFINKQGKWNDCVISTFTANQKSFTDFLGQPKLMKGDIFFFENKFWKLINYTNNNMRFLEHFELKNKDGKGCTVSKTPAAFQKINPKRVHISPCGVFKLVDFEFSPSEKNI